MHIHFPIVISCILNELHGIVEHTLDIFSHMVFQMIFLITYLTSEVISRVISSAIDHMSDSMFLQNFLVWSDDITT
jgi:hypothetical protein